MRFTSVNNSRIQVNWTAQFTVVDGDAKALGDGVKAGVLDLGIDGLSKGSDFEMTQNAI